jgi:hypothetical protein
MTQVFNVYCDESGHLEHDPLGVMVLGAIWCPQEKTRGLRTVGKAERNFEFVQDCGRRPGK